MAEVISIIVSFGKWFGMAFRQVTRAADRQKQTKKQNCPEKFSKLAVELSLRIRFKSV